MPQFSSYVYLLNATILKIAKCSMLFLIHLKLNNKVLIKFQVIINIERDGGPPVFQNLPYSTRIDHDHSLNTWVLLTTAIDRDLKGRVMYKIIGDTPAPSFFALASETSGRIVLKNDLKMDSINNDR